MDIRKIQSGVLLSTLPSNRKLEQRFKPSYILVPRVLNRVNTPIINLIQEQNEIK